MCQGNSFARLRIARRSAESSVFGALSLETYTLLSCVAQLSADGRHGWRRVWAGRSLLSHPHPGIHVRSCRTYPNTGPRPHTYRPHRTGHPLRAAANHDCRSGAATLGRAAWGSPLRWPPLRGPPAAPHQLGKLRRVAAAAGAEQRTEAHGQRRGFSECFSGE
jgi:hypothetical protein